MEKQEKDVAVSGLEIAEKYRTGLLSPVCAGNLFTSRKRKVSGFEGHLQCFGKGIDAVVVLNLLLQFQRLQFKKSTMGYSTSVLYYSGAQATWFPTYPFITIKRE